MFLKLLKIFLRTWNNLDSPKTFLTLLKCSLMLLKRSITLLKQWQLFHSLFGPFWAQIFIILSWILCKGLISTASVSSERSLRYHVLILVRYKRPPETISSLPWPQTFRSLYIRPRSRRCCQLNAHGLLSSVSVLFWRLKYESLNDSRF